MGKYPEDIENLEKCETGISICVFRYEDLRFCIWFYILSSVLCENHL